MPIAKEISNMLDLGRKAIHVISFVFLHRKYNKNDVKHLVEHFKCSRRENTGAVFEIKLNAHRLRYSDNVCENGA